MSIRRRVERLETASEGRGCSPDCPPITGVVYRQDGPEGVPVVLRQEGPLPPNPCPRCGRPGEVEEVLETVIRTREEARRALAEFCTDGGDGS